MSEENNFYRLNTLMGYTDIDAFAAQKNAGSRHAYFDILDQYIAGAPALAETLERMPTEGGVREFTLFLGELQDILLQVGATSMMWEAGKVAALAREKEAHGTCVDESFILAAKMRGLAERLQEAKIEEPEETPSAPSRPVEGLAADRASGPAAAAKPEPFEKLMVLIENFELDDALVMLRSLLDYAYDSEVDATLVTVYNQLAAFDYDNALQNLRAALRTMQDLEKGEAHSGKKKILAVDDVPDVLSMVKGVLDKDYTVYAVTNHKAALKFLASKHADLILLDIEMPHMDGFAMLGVIRRIKAYAHTPVLFLTGNASAENVKKSHTLGANDFIRKPVDAEVLLSKVEKHLSP